ncbi:hypothetical protein P7K49_018497, partial [Saguinus oedipus]
MQCQETPQKTQPLGCRTQPLSFYKDFLISSLKEVGIGLECAQLLGMVPVPAFRPIQPGGRRGKLSFREESWPKRLTKYGNRA